VDLDRGAEEDLVGDGESHGRRVDLLVGPRFESREVRSHLIEDVADGFWSSAITDGEIRPMKANVSGSSSKDLRVVRVQSMIRSRAEPPWFRATTEAYIASRRSAISSKTVFCITALFSK
jgi:hypothetical protein